MNEDKRWSSSCGTGPMGACSLLCGVHTRERCADLLLGTHKPRADAGVAWSHGPEVQGWSRSAGVALRPCGSFGEADAEREAAEQPLQGETMVGSERLGGVLGCLALVPGPGKCRVLLGTALKGPPWGHVPEWVALEGAQDALRATGQRQQVMWGASTPRRGKPGRDAVGGCGGGG